MVVQRGGEPPLLVTKGAPESVMARCSQVREDHDPTAPGGMYARPLDGEHDRLAKLVDGASADGFRLVAVGSRELAAGRGAPAWSRQPRDAGRARARPHLRGRDPLQRPAQARRRRRRSPQLARQGIALKVITGDNDLVARHVAGQVGLQVEGVLTGDEMRKLTHPALVARAPRTTIFARVDPDQKLQVIRALRESGHVVGYMGDGINDAPALHVADVGISVDNATDVARSAADIILLEPSLAAISQGVTEGRRTFANTLKYIRMGTSSNFGNMLSMAGAALLLPFLPMTPGQILLNNLIYDASQTAIPTDNVDPDVEAEPARWDVHAIERFMVVFGPISSIFDYVTFGLLLLHARHEQQRRGPFHTGWFVESLFTQILVVLVIRTRAARSGGADPAGSSGGDRGRAGRGGDHPAEPARAACFRFGALPLAVLAAAGRHRGRLPGARRGGQALLRPARGAAARSDRPSEGQDATPAERLAPVVDRGRQVVEDGVVVLLERRDDLEDQRQILDAALAEGVDDAIRLDAAAARSPPA